MQTCVLEKEPGPLPFVRFLDMGATLYNTLSTFDDIHVDQYEELK